MQRLSLRADALAVDKNPVETAQVFDDVVAIAEFNSSVFAADGCIDNDDRIVGGFADARRLGRQRHFAFRAVRLMDEEFGFEWRLNVDQSLPVLIAETGFIGEFALANRASFHE
jgi:hypothetical protein